MCERHIYLFTIENVQYCVILVMFYSQNYNLNR